MSGTSKTKAIHCQYSALSAHSYSKIRVLKTTFPVNTKINVLGLGRKEETFIVVLFLCYCSIYIFNGCILAIIVKFSDLSVEEEDPFSILPSECCMFISLSLDCELVKNQAKQFFHISNKEHEITT